jgi:RimJ/RimL family protein N-acetyltransferase
VVTLTAGAIVLIPFPFTDLSRTKLRPVLVLGSVGQQDWILAQITSNPYGDDSAIRLEEHDFNIGSLEAISYVRPGKLFTAHQRLILKNLAQLKSVPFNKISALVGNFFHDQVHQPTSRLTTSFGQPISFPVTNWTVPLPPSREPMQGQYCRLEALKPDLHARDLFEANSLDKDSRNWTYLFQGPFEHFDDYIKWMRNSCLGDDPLFYAIMDNTTHKAVGVASYLRITPAAGSIEVGNINFSPLLQKTPMATEAMYLMMKRVFELGYRRYEWKCDALNAPSRVAAQRLGFSYEGVFRQALVYKNRNRDTAWYATIDQEWPKLEAAFQTWLNPDNFDETGQQRVGLSDLTSPILVQRG